METLLVHKSHTESGLLEKLCNHLRAHGVNNFLYIQIVINNV